MRSSGERLAIISPKPQTTRNRIQGILHIPKAGKRPGAQVILIDTPGVHKPDSSLGRKMMVEVHEALEGCDLILMLVDDHAENGPAKTISHSNSRSARARQCYLLLNKIDLLRRQEETVAHHRGIPEAAQISGK